MRASLQVTVYCDPQLSTIVVAGECDEDSEYLLTDALTEVFAVEPRVLEIDVSRVEFGDSTLLHALLQAWQTQTGRRRRLVLRSPLGDAVDRLLTLTGTMDIFASCVEDGEGPESGSPGDPGANLGGHERAR
ncbi:STAS domain-containing protein [Streptomyces sp. NPDC001904]|uniref:STAS domain-containing protein n=1 Tax=Streptomyces sp. NPDC001904 TaxID=3154531 RepID=UPI00332FCBC2